MTGIMILTVIVVIAIYFYMRHTAKRNLAKDKDMDFVKSYHQNYKRSRTRKNIHGTNDGYRTYVTKYNSTEDYRERRGR